MQTQLNSRFCVEHFMYNFMYREFIHSFIHSGYFHSASSSPLLLLGASDTTRILCRSFTTKRHRQLWVKD